MNLIGTTSRVISVVVALVALVFIAERAIQLTSTSTKRPITLRDV